MSGTDPLPTTQHSRRPARWTLLAVGAAALGAATFAVATNAAAVDSTGTPTATSSTPADDDAPSTMRDRLRKRFGDLGRHGPGMFGMAGGIHGEFVAPNGSGGYRTVLTQTGEVTDVSPTSLTVRSEDGYTHTYVVTASTSVHAGRDGIGDVSDGDTVHVMATREAGKDTALRVGDLTGMGEVMEHMGSMMGGPDRT